MKRRPIDEVKDGVDAVVRVQRDFDVLAPINPKFRLESAPHG